MPAPIASEAYSHITTPPSVRPFPTKGTAKSATKHVVLVALWDADREAGGERLLNWGKDVARVVTEILMSFYASRE